MQHEEQLVREIIESTEANLMAIQALNEELEQWRKRASAAEQLLELHKKQASSTSQPPDPRPEVIHPDEDLVGGVVNQLLTYPKYRGQDRIKLASRLREDPNFSLRFMHETLQKQAAAHQSGFGVPKTTTKRNDDDMEPWQKVINEGAN